MRSFLHRVLPILLVLFLAISLVSCDQREPIYEEPDEIYEDIEEDLYEQEEEEEEPEELPPPLYEHSAKAREFYETYNTDAVGWLYVPNTSLDDPVVWYPNDFNEFYLRRDAFGNDLFDGSYFADFRTVWGNFEREEISRNIVIYGHSMVDDPDAPLFSQFKRWWDADFARENPYVFFSTLEEDMAWEIFSAHFTNVWVPYNNPNPTDEEFQILIDDAKGRSIWTYYEIEVGIEDTIITFSTCIYAIPAKASPTGERIPLAYPNNYRFVIMARLVERDVFLSEEVALIPNEDIIHARTRP